MTLPFKPHVIALVCSAGLFAASGVLYVKSRTPEAPLQPAPVAVQPQPTAAANVQSTTPTVIKIEPADPQVVYVPNYNPATVYGAWPNTAYPPVYLPPPPGQQFADSFVKGFGYSLGVATTYALFSSIDWDDDHHHHDDDHHHHDDNDHHGGNGYQHNGDNININVNNFNHITGQNLKGQTMAWQHNPAYRNGVPYQNNAVSQRFHQTDVSGGLSATQQTPASRDGQRQAAMAQFQQHSHASPATRTQPPGATSRDAQRKAASQQLNQIAQRNNYRGYDTRQDSVHRESAQSHSLSQPQRETVHQRVASATPQQRQTFRQNHANVFSGNDSRSPSWQSQQQRGQQSRHVGNLNTEQRAAAREHLSERHEFRRR
ncbi:hypothetical protein BN1086_03088 [Citrobacter koseri]|uniref:DUF3300 domain-containing protein n=1 Tax=Citrobacter koseri TaxID=545 RepID=A0A078LHZ5_CITKO|nr:hypothetical protein BN1086_03088 [Citrobacter koseri]